MGREPSRPARIPPRAGSCAQQVRPIYLASGPQPPIDDYRPIHCLSCGGNGLHGHGLRLRWLILAASRGDHVLQIWVRRFRCPHCGKTITVLPDGVWPGFIYSVEAILYAWTLATLHGLTEAAVCARQGEDRGLDVRYPGLPRWRSLSRWTKQIPSRWPEAFVTGQTWRQRAARLVLHLAPAGHAPCGAVM